MKRYQILALLAALVLLVSACGGADSTEGGNGQTDPQPDLADSEHGAEAPGVEHLGQLNAVNQHQNVADQQNAEAHELIDPERFSSETLSNAGKAVMLIAAQHNGSTHESSPDKGRRGQLLREIGYPAGKTGCHLPGRHDDEQHQRKATHHDLDLLKNIVDFFEYRK